MKKRIVTYILIILIITGTVYAVTQTGSSEVAFYEVRKGSFLEYIELRGKVELDKREKVYTRVTGILQNMKVSEGNVVAEGDQLAQLVVQDMDTAISKARAAYNAERAALEDLKKSIKPEQVKQAEAQVTQAQVGVDTARADYQNKKDKLDKARTLFKTGSISEQELKDLETVTTVAENSLKDAQQRHSIAKYNYEQLNQGVSKEAIQAAEARVEQMRLQIEELNNNRGRTSIYSGIKGIILAKLAENGMTVQQGTPIYEIGDNDTAYIRVDALTDDAVKVSLGQKVFISGEAVGKDEARIQGEVYYIAPKAVSSVSSLGIEQQRVEMRIKYDTGLLKLKPGYGVDIDIITGEKSAAYFVPDKAIFEKEEKDYVFVLKQGRLELRKVKKGMENKNQVEILEGLSEGEMVVVDPDNSLKAGMKVRQK